MRTSSSPRPRRGSRLFKAEWIRPGTHIAGMGSDARGKQELPSEIFERAKLF